MKKIISRLLILLVLLLISLSSCSKSNVKYLSEDEFFNSFYEAINKEGTKYIGYMFIDKDIYENGHIKQIQNYDTSKGSIDELITILKRNSKNTIVYLIEPSKDVVESIKGHFKKIYVYDEGYDTVKSSSLDMFIISKGEYDCGC